MESEHLINVVALETVTLARGICQVSGCPPFLWEKIIREAFLMDIVVYETINGDRDIDSYNKNQYNKVVDDIIKETKEFIKKQVEARIHTLPNSIENN